MSTDMHVDRPKCAVVVPATVLAALCYSEQQWAGFATHDCGGSQLGLADSGQDFSGLAKTHRGLQPHRVCIHLLLSSLGADVFFHKGRGGGKNAWPGVRSSEVLSQHIVTLDGHCPALFPHSPLAM